MINKITTCCLLAALLAGCGLLKDNPKYGFTEGYYNSRKPHKKPEKVYLSMEDDTIKVYAAERIRRDGTVDLVTGPKAAFAPAGSLSRSGNGRFSCHRFDLDLLSIPFKYRPSACGFPRQFNVFLNGALYGGYRTDHYCISYKKTPLGSNRRLTHRGYSLGVFSGVGTAHIDPFVTLNGIDYEYDGVVNLSGVAALVAIDRFSLGVTAGIDHLLDRNHTAWINNRRLWTGITIGLNLQ